MSIDNPEMRTNNLKDFEQIYNNASSSTKRNILEVASKTLGESSIPLLIKGLEEYDSSINDISIGSLLSLKMEGISFSSSSLARFEQIYNNASFEKKVKVLELIAKIFKESSIPFLFKALDNYDSSISNAAINSLVNLKKEGITFSSCSLKDFEKLYNRPSYQKKVEALELVTKLLKDSSIPLLIRGLGENNSSVSDAARDSLLSLKKEGISFSSYSLKDFDQIYNNASLSTKKNILKVANKALGESSIPLLIKGLEEYDSSINDISIDILLSLKMEGISFSSYSLAYFEQIYNNASFEKKVKVLELIAKIFKESSIPLLFKALDNYDSSISNAAINSLVNLKMEGISFSSCSLNDFEKFYNKTSYQKKVEILELAAKIFGQSASPLLIRGLGENNSDISDAARDLLNKLNKREKETNIKNETYEEEKEKIQNIKNPEDTEANKNIFSQNGFKYDVALSFAGENREIVHSIAKKLQEKQISVFYDEFEKTHLWGKRLSDHFKLTYGKNTRFVIPFISNEYSLKNWTNFEFTIARGEAKNREEEFILPVRLDDTLILGLHEDIGYLHFNEEGVDGIVNALINKLKK